MSKYFINFKNFLVDFFFPINCIVCGNSGTVICENCFSKIPTNVKDKNNILSVYEYRDARVNKLLWKLKYKHTHQSAEVFGKQLAKHFKNWFLDFSNIEQIILIPVPLNNNDKRLYNHAQLLAEEISKNLNILNKEVNLESAVITEMLVKNSKKKQAHSGRKKNRIENIEKTISINPHFSPFVTKGVGGIFKNYLYVIVDDVTTTGATIGNIRNVLSEYLNIPEENILGLTVAH